jgi:hypothetical protein
MASSTASTTTTGADLKLLREFLGEASASSPSSASSASSGGVVDVVPLDANVVDRLHQQRKINAALQTNKHNKHNEHNEHNNATASSTSISISTRNFPFSLRDRTKSPPFVIFYNVYIPMDQGEQGVRKSLDIITEQVGQVGSSYAASFPGKPVTIFYNTIGKKDVVHQQHMSHICADHNNVLCIHLQHYEEGFELLTLQRVYDYCQYSYDTSTSSSSTSTAQQHQQRATRMIMIMMIMVLIMTIASCTCTTRDPSTASTAKRIACDGT